MTDRASAAVFVSYAREDSDAARRIADDLRSHGFEVWFDQDELRGGEAWDQKLRRQIKECALFVPVVSANTQERREGYFRLEWKLAAERTHLMAEGVPFIAPVVIDETKEAAALVPAEFMRVQWTRLPGAKVTLEFAEQVKRLLGPTSEVARVSRPVSSGNTVQETRATAKVGRRVPAAAWGLAVAGGLAAAVIVAWQMRQSPDAGAGTRPPTAEKSAPAAPAAAVVSDKSIAVLPFENRSTDKENVFFADDVHDDILGRLTNVRELRVVSLASVEEYRDTKKPLRQVARELGVAWVLKGSVRRAGNQVRVSAQLIDARTDAQVWSPPPFIRELTDVFAIQSEIAQSIAAELKTVLSPEEKRLLERRPTENLAAYDLFLKARRLKADAADQSSHDEEISLFRKAVELDRSFSAAWAELATQYGLRYAGTKSPADLLEATTALAEVARLEAPGTPARLYAEANYSYRVRWDLASAESQFRQLIQIRPNDTWALIGLAVVQYRQGNWQGGISSFRLASELDVRNRSWLQQLREILIRCRRFDEALGVQSRMMALDPSSLVEGFTLAELSFLASGSRTEMEQWLGRLPVVEGNAASHWMNLRWAYDDGDLAGFLHRSALQAPSGIRALLARHLGSSVTRRIVADVASGDVVGARAKAETELPALRASLKQQAGNRLAKISLSRILAVLGEKAEAQRYAQELVDSMPESLDAGRAAEPLANRVFVLAWTGNKERALEELAILLRKPGMGLLLNVHVMRRSLEWKPLQGDPRFEALLNDPKNNAPLF